jgi:HK97 family phage prohead protease
MRFYCNLTKVDEEQRMVWGYASTEAIDAHGETITKGAIEAALDDYMEFANIREMHQLSAVGTAEEASVDDKGLYLCAHVVDDTAWEKVTKGVYRGFSIGGKVLARDKDDKKIITKLLLTEISLVDRPSNPEARFDVWKAAGSLDKCISDLPRFARVLKDVRGLVEDAEADDKSRDNEHQAASAIRKWFNAGLGILRTMAREEYDEFAAVMSEAAGADRVDAAHAALGKLERALQPDPADVIMKAFAAKDAEIDQLRKRIDELLAEPAPPKTAGAYGFFAVSKEDDAGGAQNLRKAEPDQDDIVAALQAMPEEERALLLTKAALQLPRPVRMGSQ